MMICVTLLACAKPITSSAMPRPPPGMVIASPPSASRQPQRIGDAVALLLGQLQAAPRLDVERRPRRMQPVGQPLGVAHEAGRARVFADADQDALARRPRPRDRMRLHLGEQLLVDALGGAAQRQLAQRRQVAGREVVLQRALGLLGDVDLAFLEPLDQIVRREVDELDGVGAVEDRVRHGLAHPHMGDLRDDVVEALDVLDVDGGVDVDAAVEQLLDIEVALGMTAARRVGVGELVDQRDLGAAGDDGVEIHLLEPLPLVFETAARDDLETLEQGLGLLASMRLDDADDDIVAVLSSWRAPAAASRRSCRRPGAAPTKILSRPELRSSRRAASSKASGEGRCSGSRR